MGEMRGLVVLAALMLAATPALAQRPAPPVIPPKAAPKPPPKPAPVPTLAPSVGVSAPPRSPLPNAAADAANAQCAATCSRTYYLCLAGDAADLCAGDWAQCKVRCGNTARRLGP